MNQSKPKNGKPIINWKSLLIPRIKAPNPKNRRKLQKHPFQSIRKEACSNEWNCLCMFRRSKHLDVSNYSNNTNW
jgi:hypothetical protein